MRCGDAACRAGPAARAPEPPVTATTSRPAGVTTWTAARWTALCAVAYNLLHHLGALPGGLGDAGGGTRWVDWLDLLTPWAVVGTALAALAAAGTDRRGWWLALTGAAVYVQGHGVHLAANSIGNERGDLPPIHLWDEVVGHWLWYGGAALLALALLRAVPLPTTPPGLALALATGLTWTTNGLEGTTAVGSLLAASGLAVAARRRGNLLFAVAFGTGAVLLAGYGLWHGGFPAPSAR
jgi:hypothetical protein